MTIPSSHIYDYLEQVIADVEANAAQLRADAETERGKAERPNDPADEHNRAAAQLDWHADDCDRAIAMYHDAIANLRAHRRQAS